MTVYLDTSSLVKLYVLEPGSDRVRELVSGAAVTVTSNVAYPETRAALAKRRRDKTLTAQAFRTARRDFDTDWRSYSVIPTTPELCREAGDLAERYFLRGLDSIHLSSFAEMLRELQGSDDVQFSSFDERLNRAARRLARTIA